MINSRYFPGLFIQVHSFARIGELKLHVWKVSFRRVLGNDCSQKVVLIVIRAFCSWIAKGGVVSYLVSSSLGFGTRLKSKTSCNLTFLDMNCDEASSWRLEEENGRQLEVYPCRSFLRQNPGLLERVYPVARAGSAILSSVMPLARDYTPLEVRLTPTWDFELKLNEQLNPTNEFSHRTHVWAHTCLHIRITFLKFSRKSNL